MAGERKAEEREQKRKWADKWKANRLFVYQIVIAILVLVLYAAGCYPVYIGVKTKVIYRLYAELQETSLANLDDDDTDSLSSFQKEKIEIIVADDQMNRVYTSRDAVRENYIKRHIENKLDLYKENAVVDRRILKNRHVLVLRGKIVQDKHTYYVYLRKDIQSGMEVIRGSLLYFAAALALVLLNCFLFSRKNSQQIKKESRQSDYQLMERQREFVANISHELKTPLAVVSSQVEMLEIAGDKIDRSYYYDSIREELDKMSKMVGELLDFSMLDNRMSSMEMSRVNVSELAEYLMLRYDAIFQKNEIKVEKEIEKNCFTYGNRMYLERAVNNYLMNAFQHTEQGKKIRLSLKAEKQWLRLDVYNDGERITEEQMEHIWDSFYTSSRKKQPSSAGERNIGLGLFTVRKIVEKHQGSCGAENKENGVLFWMKLPIDKA